ncbi:hypothetical protein ACF0H5_015033 [Mactra antiquata]
MNEIVCILLYAVDIVLWADSEDDLKRLINALHDWCSCNNMLINSYVKVPCGKCAKSVSVNHRGIYCEACYYWWHMKCASITPSQLQELDLSPDPWICQPCLTFHFTDSYFDMSSNTSISSSDDRLHTNCYDELHQIRNQHKSKFLVCHMNINSLRNKFMEIYDIFSNNLCDLFFISETKLDSSFRDSLYTAPGYKLERRDRNSFGGGIAAFIRADIPARRRKDLEIVDTETLCFEIILNKTKWLICFVYRPPSMPHLDFFNSMIPCVDKILTQYDNFMLLGDLNFDLLCNQKGKPLSDFIELFHFSNLIKSATCFVKNCTPSLLDCILTNSKQLCFKTVNFPTAVSDCHNMIGTVINNTVPKVEKRKTEYRSFKQLNESELLNDLNSMSIPTFDKAMADNSPVNELYEHFENELNTVFNKHIPIKQKCIKQQQLPYMNSKLRKAIYHKKMTYHKFMKSKTSKTWENYRKSRNYVNKLKKQSMNKYFLDRCVGGSKQTNFWDTVKPYFSNKHKSAQAKIILNEDSKVISDTPEVAEIFNDFFVNVAGSIGEDYVFDPKSHPSLDRINNQNFKQVSFMFELTNEENVCKVINKFNVKKATGVDNISVKMLKIAKPAIVQPLTNIINISISKNCFPDKLKLAQVTPLYKKGDALSKSNYRPVSILPISSKIFEKILSQQLTTYFDDIFNKFLCAFRKGHGCQTTLLRLLEDWKQALDRHEYVAAILMDLSKAFDCLPHDILMEKLSAYGLSRPATDLLQSYLTNRKQQIKIGNVVSDWGCISKGVPLGSILGPLLFNVFINDIFYFINKGDLYNYADDNTLSFHTPNFNELISVLESESHILINWFYINKMEANPDKFQAIAVGKRTSEMHPTFNLGNFNVNCEETVKLLGIGLDYQLNFNTHISTLCKKATMQLNILKRLGNKLNLLNRITIFHTFILSNFNFCPLAWHFCSKSNTDKIEKVQERALRFVYDDYTSSYHFLLNKINMPSLQVRRMRTIAIETFKILNNLAPTVLTDLLIKKDNKYNFRYSNVLQIPKVNSNKYGKNSFRFAAPTLWNTLPNEFRLCTSFGQFKSLVSNWNGKCCNCAYCKS